MTTDPTVIRSIALQKTDENLRFRSFLKQEDSSKLDDHFRSLFERITPEIDCTVCGNCCRHLQAPVLQSEIRALSEAVGLSIGTFRSRYLTRTPAFSFISQEPCPFLSETRCSVYANRPSSCRSYPHLAEPGIKDRLYSVLDNYAICPIVFNVIEELKAVTGFDRGEQPKIKTDD